MKIAYFNCSSGIAGDMILASLIDAGLSAKLLEKLLKKYLGLKNWNLELRTTKSLYHIPVKQVVVKGEKHFDSPSSMISFIKKSSLPVKIKAASLMILDSMINAEAKAHKFSVDKVHFHELGSLDTIIDVTGSCLAIDLLDIKEVYSSAINIGKPAPAALEIIKDKKTPVYSNNSNYELATPTGLAIISNICRNFGEMPEMNLESYGMGAGMHKISNNYLVVSVGFAGAQENPCYSHDEVVVLDTNIDDMDPRIYPYLTKKLLTLGAKDVWLTQVLMKKGRPGIVLSVICDKKKEKAIVDTLFNETTTLGIRRRISARYILNRRSFKDEKIAYLPNGKSKSKSEFEIVKLNSIRNKIPLKNII